MILHLGKGVIYLDPFTPQGCFGLQAVRQHLEKFFKDHPGLLASYCDWLTNLDVSVTVVEVLPIDSMRYAVRSRLSRPDYNIKIWAMFFIVLNSEGQILQLEIFYDPSILSKTEVRTLYLQRSLTSALGRPFTRIFG